MTTTASVAYQFRLDTQLRDEAFQVFNELGMNPAEGLRVFLKQVALTRSIPFAIQAKPAMATTEKHGYVPSAAEYEAWHIQRITASKDALAAGKNPLLSLDEVRLRGLASIQAATEHTKK
jgi:addiction module RelB/DinJ family antitoxin